jgi:hypothetical protein
MAVASVSIGAAWQMRTLKMAEIIAGLHYLCGKFWAIYERGERLCLVFGPDLAVLPSLQRVGCHGRASNKVFIGG